MKPYASGQGATFFQETAKLLHYLVLKNQKPQQTRFVRAVLRAIHAFGINCPTLRAIAAKELSDCIEAGDNTGAKKAEKICNELSNGEMLASVFGLSQILEVYAEMSVISQFSNIFPTTVWKKVDEGREKLKQYAENWVWEESPLKMSGIGAPSDLIKNLLEGKYEAYATETQIKRHEAWNSVGVNAKSLINEIEIELDLNDRVQGPNQTTVGLGPGEMVVVGFTPEKKLATEEKMQKLCKKLVEGMDKRIKKTDLQKMFIHFFDTFTSEKEDTSVDQLQILINSLPGPHAEVYSAIDCLPGYVTWLQFGRKAKDQNPNITHERIWESFVAKHGKSFSNFVDLYEDINIRTMSEAMAETVGSIMNAAIAKGRNPHPFNLSVEICLCFNLPPLHCMEEMIEEILDQRLKDKAVYIHHTDSTRPDELISSTLSASVFNFRSE